jgi:predicted AlkP superfamily phosphohydrolase/phosphomutase
VAALALLGALLAAPFVGCRPSPATPGAPVRLLLVGLDGASWDFLDPMIERGAVPNLARFSREGVRGSLQTLRPALSPAIWTTIATGRAPSEHGITGFEATDGQGFIASSGRRTEALWTILTRARRTVGFVGWWVTWPAEEVSERFLRPGHEGLEDATYPRTLAREVDAGMAAEWPWLRQALQDGRLKLLSDRKPGPEPLTPARLQLADFFYGQDHRGEQAALHVLRHRPRPELFGFLSRKIDIASHYMARFTAEGRLGAEEMSRVLEPVYRYEDGLLGRLVEAAGEGASILVVSDHGFERTADGYDHKDTSPPGILVAWGPLFREGLVLKSVSVFDVTPTVLHVLGLPVARDMKGAVLSGALRDHRPVAQVATYETGRRRAEGRPSSQDELIREELKALGYIQ